MRNNSSRKTLFLLGLLLFFPLESTIQAAQKDYDIHIVKPISDHKILPFDESIPSLAQDIIFVRASRGEYEPASFVIRANDDIKALRITASPLKGTQGAIDIKEIDIKVVKCWYQAGTAWQSVAQDKSKKF